MPGESRDGRAPPDAGLATAQASPMSMDRVGRRWALALGALAAITVAAVAYRYSGADPEAGQTPLTPVQTPDARHTPVDCQGIPARNPMVILVLGQSNAANHGQAGEPPAAPRPGGVYAYFAGGCYLAADPMPGATGTGASFMPRLGALLVDKRVADAVLFVPMAIESTRVEDWAEHPEIQRRLRDTLAGLASRNLQVTHVLWQQGEADNNRNTTSAAYRQGLTRFIQGLRAMGVGAPVFVARTSYCKGKGNSEITSVQAQMVDAAAGILAGPDIDALVGDAWRADGCHFTARGLAAVANLWAETLVSRAPGSEKAPEPHPEGAKSFLGRPSERLERRP